MRDFFSGRHCKILAGIAICLLVLLIAGSASGAFGRVFTGALELATLPFEAISAGISGTASDFFSFFEDTAALQQRIADLEQEVSTLQQQLVDYENMRQENEQLREMNGITAEHDDWELEPASVISRDPHERFHSFTIDLGSIDGVAVDDPVVTEQGLVGIISSVNLTTSKVRTILDPNINVGATEAAGRYSGLITGSAALSAEEVPQTRMIYIKRDSILYEGQDIIKTSEIGGRFPSDIVIGTVVSAYPESTGTSMTAVIDPAVDVLSVRNVFVITDFRGQGAEVVDGKQDIDIFTEGMAPSDADASASDGHEGGDVDG